MHTPALTKRAPAPIVIACTALNAFAVTFDDGPNSWTHEPLDYLDVKNVKVTLFVNGFNYNSITDPEMTLVVKRAFDAGH
jgi:peptidoglycan/xylan/chitin deacetylase (PgdA/CDA1 family)